MSKKGFYFIAILLSSVIFADTKIITRGISQSVADGRYVNSTGDLMTGVLELNFQIEAAYVNFRSGPIKSGGFPPVFTQLTRFVGYDETGLAFGIFGSRDLTLPYFSLTESEARLAHHDGKYVAAFSDRIEIATGRVDWIVPESQLVFSAEEKHILFSAASVSVPEATAGEHAVQKYYVDAAAPVLVGGFFLTSSDHGGASGAAAPSATANQLRVYQFSLNKNITIDTLSWYQSATGGAGSKVCVGIYGIDGNKITVAEGVSADGTNPLRSASAIPPTTLRPGIYYLAWSVNESSSSLRLLGVSAGENIFSALNINTPRFGTAANATVSNVMPETLGTISASTLDGVLPTIIGE